MLQEMEFKDVSGYVDNVWSPSVSQSLLVAGYIGVLQSSAFLVLIRGVKVSDVSSISTL